MYYVNPTIVAANAAAKRTLDPHSIDGLVYAQTPAGTEVLAAAMYILPSTLATAADALRPAGPVASAHRCVWPVDLGDRQLPSRSPAWRRVPEGTVQKPTPYMTMVWQVPVAGGPLAIQPPDIQIVEASVMESVGSR